MMLFFFRDIEDPNSTTRYDEDHAQIRLVLIEKRITRESPTLPSQPGNIWEQMFRSIQDFLEAWAMKPLLALRFFTNI